MFAKLEAYARAIHRRLSRSEWAIRHLGLTPSAGTAEEPGLLLIQIDGFARTQLENALEKGRMPFLKKLRRQGRYSLHTFYPGLPTTTPAVQAELYYGVRAGVPAFSFLDRKKGEMGMMFQSDWAKSFEAKFQEKAEGLLKGGSSWSNIYTGGASQEESHFCAASIGFGDMWRSGKIWNIFIFICLNLPSAVRIAALLILELIIAIPAAIGGVFRGQWIKPELIMVLSRTFIGIGLRELVTIGGKVDVARGLPIIHVNYLGFDELAHRRGPSSSFAHWSLSGIDRAIKGLYRNAHRSSRRDYQVWIFSDHGQERTRSFATEFPGGVEQVIATCLESSRIKDPAWRPRVQSLPTGLFLSRRRYSETRRQREAAAFKLTEEESKTFSVAAMGPVGHVYFAQPMDDEKKRALAKRLVKEGKIPGVLHRTAGGNITWYHAGGATPVPEGVPAHLFTHPEALRTEIARDLVTFCENENAGDLILLGWTGDDRPWSFASERGAHAGLGPEEVQGFLLVPPATRLPPGSAHFVRPAGLRAAALDLLGRSALEDASFSAAGGRAHARVMTYNTHNCGGMDGRVSPRRVARVILREAPDIVALQELDHGRPRSRSEDQSSAIAQALGFNVVFCPTVIRGEDRYGHALLSRWQIEVVKLGPLPSDPKSWLREARGALWARVKIGSTAVNVVTTHLGLGVRERFLQMEALLGKDWLGPILEKEPVILCGDFNLMPGSAPYGLAAAKLNDVQAARKGHRPLSTFSSLQPFTRIDHIFVSKHFETRKVVVPRTELTRLASDHLPLVADLAWPSSTGETQTHTPQ